MNRRIFLNKTGIAVAGLCLPWGSAIAKIPTSELINLTILHTNDVHSRIDPFPEDGSRNAGNGGAVRRAKLINAIRAKEENVLLLDSGDIFQGTPYFNFYGGELEMKLMSQMGYDAATMGNHDFDAGLDGFIKQLPHANFPMVISNYDFKDTDMHDKYKDYVVFQKGDLKIGVFGIGIELAGLVPKKLYGNTQYLDPITEANRVANNLKNEEKVDLVICLSHLGYKYREDKIDDVKLAKMTDNIDIILGGHTHTFMYKPHLEMNKKGEAVIISQAGWAGIMLGRLDIYFERGKANKCFSCDNMLIKNA